MAWFLVACCGLTKNISIPSRMFSSVFLAFSSRTSLYAGAERDGITLALLHRSFMGLQSKEKV